MQRPDAHSPPRLTPIAATYSVIVLALLLLFYFAIIMLTGMRGFVGGESSWSKSQKQAAACLQRYAVTGAESEFSCYSGHTALTHAARRTREELQKADADMDTVLTYLVRADAHPKDAPAMATLMRQLAWHPLVRDVNETWAQADAEIDSMHVLALQLREQVARGVTHDNTRVNDLIRDIRATDERLTALEYRFSQQIGEGARYIGQMLLILVVATAAVLLGIALFFSSRWIRAWGQTQRLANDRAARMRAVAGAAAAVGTVARLEELDVVLRAAIDQVIECDLFTFGTYNAASHSFEYLAGRADGMMVPPIRVPAAGTPSERFLTDRTSIRVDHSGDPTGRGGHIHGSERKSESVIRSAMHSGSRLIGMIAVHSYTPYRYTADDVEVIETLASVAASAIQRLESTREQMAAEEGLRRSEEQLAQAHKMEAVGLLAGGVAHDFNNLVTAIKGNADLLIDDEALPADLRDHISEIAAAADRAAALTGQLLAFSRRQVLQPRVVNLNTLVTHMVTLISRLIGEDMQLLTSLDAELGNVRADPHQMEQVILNLTLNARDAMAQRGSLVIETCNVDVEDSSEGMPSIGPGSYVRLAVQDTGVGIDPETRDRIFEPFFTTKGVGKGTGLGLSTVYGIVKQSDGHIYVVSEPGMGTTMQIFLPRSHDPVDPPLADPTPRSRATPPSNVTVLVVEDELTVRTLLSRVLTREGYNVIEAASGEEAIAILSADIPVDLVVTDTVMPGMSGVALAERATAMRPGLAILHMSGYTEDEVFRRGLSRRGDRFLQKPFSPAVLLSGVADALANERDS